MKSLAAAAAPLLVGAAFAQSPPGANRLLGVWWAGKLLYPQTFDFDLRAKVTEFHRLFYHRGPSDAQLDALLGEPGVLPP